MQKKKIFLRRLLCLAIVCLLFLIELLPIASNITFAADSQDMIEFIGYFSSENAEKASSFVSDVRRKNIKNKF